MYASASRQKVALPAECSMDWTLAAAVAFGLGVAVVTTPVGVSGAVFLLPAVTSRRRIAAVIGASQKTSEQQTHPDLFERHRQPDQGQAQGDDVRLRQGRLSNVGCCRGTRQRLVGP